MEASSTLGVRARYFHLGKTLAAMQRDPALFQAGNNLYNYGNGDPVSYIDPDGDFGFFVAAAAIGFGYTVYKAYKTGKKWRDKNMARFRKSQKGSEKDLIEAEQDRKKYQQKANKEVTAAGASVWKGAAGAATGLSNDVMDTVEFSVEVHGDVTAEDEAEEEDAGWW